MSGNSKRGSSKDSSQKGIPEFLARRKATSGNPLIKM